MDIDFLTSQSELIVTGKIVPNCCLDFVPRIFTTAVCIGPYFSDKNAQNLVWKVYDKEIGNTFGSEESDRFRFSSQYRTLNSVHLAFPYDNIIINPINMMKWLKTKRVVGLPRLDRECYFTIDTPENRYISDDGMILAALFDFALNTNSEDTLRLSIAKDVDLLFLKRRYCGWIVQSPANYLVANDVRIISGPRQTDEDTIFLFKRYLTLVDESFMDTIQQNIINPTVLEVISLYEELNNLHSDGGGPRDAMREELKLLFSFSSIKLEISEKYKPKP